MYRIGQVAAQLDISPGTVRRWSDRFAPWLSDESGNPELLESGRRATRLYCDRDVEVLLHVQQMKEGGMSEEEIAQQFQAADGDLLAIQKADENGIVLHQEAAAALEMLRQAVEGQQAIISAQQAQRELLNSVVADALGLKDENERLRKRQRMMEEEMARLKESDWNHQRTLEERMTKLEQQLQQQATRSWWQRLLRK